MNAENMALRELSDSFGARESLAKLRVRGRGFHLQCEMLLVSLDIIQFRRLWVHCLRHLVELRRLLIR